MSPEESVRAVAKAMLVIREHGWIRGDYGNPSIGYCLVGALSVGASYRPSIVEVLEGRIDQLFPGELEGSLVQWNDGYATSEKMRLLIESFIGPEKEPVTAKDDPAHEFDIR